MFVKLIANEFLGNISRFFKKSMSDQSVLKYCISTKSFPNEPCHVNIIIKRGQVNPLGAIHRPSSDHKKMIACSRSSVYSIFLNPLHATKSRNLMGKQSNQQLRVDFSYIDCEMGTNLFIERPTQIKSKFALLIGLWP
jgi:hypothetical protein